MRAGFYNIRDYGRPARRTQIKEFITRQHLDFVALQETMKSSFSPADLRVIDPLSKFAWHHSLVMGHSGGMLLGVNEDSFDVLGWGSGAFFLRVDVRQLDTSKEWSLFVVYGPADHRKSGYFLAELSHAVGACPLPLVVGGDFNLIRGSEDKNNDNIDWPRVHRFNDCITNLGLSGRSVGLRLSIYLDESSVRPVSVHVGPGLSDYRMGDPLPSVLPGGRHHHWF
jgi:hypothetical protein